MGTLIDSSVLIAAEREALPIDALLARHGASDAAVSAITATEVLHGIHRAPAGAIKARREAFIEKLLLRLPVVPFDLVAARIHARIGAGLAAKGTPVGDHDLLIGATALAIGYQVATRDVRSFPRIPGLKVLRW